MRALLSVYDKTGIIDLARTLSQRGFDILSTGGTLATLQAAHVPATAVAEVTGFPEILDGRVKTLHPRIHGGLLARRDDPHHLAQIAQHDIVPLDLLAVNLYPFAQTVADPAVSVAEAIEQIDIGGPAMVRAGAKNFPSVIVLTDPADYDDVLAALDTGDVGLQRRRELAAKAFAHVAAYDAVVAAYLREESHDLAPWPEQISIAGQKARQLRYGENPQQRAAAYRRLQPGRPVPGILDAAQLAGQELSYNNLLDADAAWSAVQRWDGPAAAIVKHTIPCGLAVRDCLADAFSAALAGDPVSAFGGIVALNRDLDKVTAQRLNDVRFDIIIAPGYDGTARALLSKRKSLRLLSVPMVTTPGQTLREVRSIRGGLLIQDGDDRQDDPAQWRVVTRREPTERERQDAIFAWEVVRHVKSNAIVIARDRAVLGVGSGQPNRVESVRIAVSKAGDRAQDAVLASDAFFPFGDGLQVGIDAGITTAVQPGGSVRDQEVIDAADAAGIAMLFTGTRHFRH